MAAIVNNKYVFPPQFDFLRNSKAKPVSMYIFEFEHAFDKQDLADIWTYAIIIVIGIIIARIVLQVVKKRMSRST